MAVLRGNKDSLMAVLEAFVYDPLLNWRLVRHYFTCFVYAVVFLMTAYDFC